MKPRNITLTLALLLLLAAGAFLLVPRLPEPRKLDVSFFLHLERDTDYWVGDLLKFYDHDGNLLALLSKASAAQSGMFRNPDTISLDLTSTGFAKTRLKREDFVDLGRPGGNVAYLAWLDGRLVASSFGRSFCRKTPDAGWEPCGTAASTLMSHPAILSKLVKWEKSKNVQPVLVGSSRVLLIGEHSRLSDCHVSSGGGFSCETVLNDFQCVAYLLAYQVMGDTVFMYCGDGDVYHYRLSTRKMRHAVAARSSDLNNQVYASYMLGNSVYLGHYPSGALLQTSGLSVGLAARPPVRAGYSTSLRELQSIGFIGGKMLVGVWPWGEVWEATLTAGALHFDNVIPLFGPASVPDDTTKNHPLENALPAPNDYNELGRRVSSIVPCWNGVCLSTSSKYLEIRQSPHVGEKTLQEYGRVFYLRGPKSSCTVALSGDHQIDLSLTGSAGALSVDGKPACAFSFEEDAARDLIRNVARIEVGSQLGERNGHYGQLRAFVRQ